MKYRNPKTGEFKDLVVKVTDTLPVGSIVDYEGATIPEGWELISQNESIKTIKKIENNLAIPGMVLNEKTTSDKDAYSCNYLNTYLNKLDKNINNLEGKLIYTYSNTHSGLETSEFNIDELSKYARIDVLCYKATDFDVESGGIWETLDNITSFVVLSMYPYGDGSFTAFYVDYYNGSPRVFERAIRVSTYSNKLYIEEGKLNGQTNKYIMVPHYIIGYKGDIIG